MSLSPYVAQNLKNIRLLVYRICLLPSTHDKHDKIGKCGYG